MIIPPSKGFQLPVIEQENLSGGRGSSAGHAAPSGDTNRRGSQVDPQEVKRNAKPKKVIDEDPLDWKNFEKNKKKREAMSSVATQEGSTKDTTSQLSGDENVAARNETYNDLPSPVLSQLTINSNSPSAGAHYGAALATNEEKAGEGGQPPTPQLGQQLTPVFGTRNMPVGEGVRLAPEYRGLPKSFGGKGADGRKAVQPRESRVTSTSSERGFLGLANAACSMAASIPSEWNAVQGGDDNRDEESSSSNVAMAATVRDRSMEKDGDGGCCEPAPRDPLPKLKTGKPLPPHQEMFIDSHCHLDFIYRKRPFRSMDALRSEYGDAFPATFQGCITNFVKPDFWRHAEWIKRIAKDGQVLGTSFGVHPHHSGTVTEEALRTLRAILVQHRHGLKVVAVGECGVDLNRNDVSLRRQLDIFKLQVQLAYDLGLPLIIHSREGGRGDPEDDILNVLKERPYHAIHRHCFTRGVAVAQKWMRTLHNVTFGFTPAILSYPNAGVINLIPLDRILLETDAPYFPTPQYDAFRLPAYTSLPGAAITVAIRIAEVKQLPLDDVIRATRLNTERIYRLPIV